jgi:hypothetical protein
MDGELRAPSEEEAEQYLEVLKAPGKLTSSRPLRSSVSSPAYSIKNSNAFPRRYDRFFREGFLSSRNPVFSQDRHRPTTVP